MKTKTKEKIIRFVKRVLNYKETTYTPIKRENFDVLKFRFEKRLSNEASLSKGQINYLVARDFVERLQHDGLIEHKIESDPIFGKIITANLNILKEEAKHENN